MATAALFVAGISAARAVGSEQAPAGFEGILKLSSASAAQPQLAAVPAAPPEGVPTTTAPPATTSPPSPVRAAPARTTPTSPPASPTRTSPSTRPSGGTSTPSPASLVEPACAQLPADIPRRALRGGQWLAKRVEGRTAGNTVYVEALPCDLYDDEVGQISVHVAGSPGTFDYVVDYGDGTSWHLYPKDFCRMAMPVTFMGQGNTKVYARPGTYVVTVHLALSPCQPAAPPETVTLSIPVERIAGPRPYPAPEVVHPGGNPNP